MPDGLSVSLDKLRKSAEKLNAITEVANQTVQSVEAFLAGLSIGVDGDANVWTDDESDYQCFLSYRRLNGRFRIAVVHGTCPEDEVVRAWAECNREEKLETIVKIPELVACIANRAEDRTTEAEEAVDVVKQVLKSLEN